MKRNIIILIALIVLFAMPVLAKPMAMVTNPLVDDGFMLDELNDEELIKVEGNHVIYDSTLPDNQIVWKGKIGGGYIYVFNDGSAIIVGEYPVNEDGSFGNPQTTYIHNYNPTNLSDYIIKK